MIGGRRGWMAWPAGLVCLGVVGALLWLAAPGIPSAVRFAGDVLRTGTLTTEAEGRATPTAPATGIAAVTEDCRSLYPDSLWIGLSWRRDTLLNQTDSPVGTSATGVRDALTPQVVMTCLWRQRGTGTVTTTLARVDASAAVIAGPGFAAAGFTCAGLGSGMGSGIRCTRSADGVVEVDVVRDGLWLSTREDQWHPDGYADQLAAHLWP